ncbi:SDR family oxidoreductase [Bizionia sediminis]|uniref:SDR family oxidoreductase n=1 Tax=Bizionia sediminis TaxID=1737064 RepID=A0ABW5KSE4_9FLAO
MYFKEKLVLITGGASGIGKIMARLLLEQQARVIIWDINPDNIAQTHQDFLNNPNLFSYQLDVTNAVEIAESANNIKQKHGCIDVLINNAGIIVGKYFSEHLALDIENTMNINTVAPMQIARLFLNDMLKNNTGHICNIASSGGLVSNPKMSVYAASKWALIGWSDSLRLEMKQQKKNIKITTIMPYYIHTGMFEGVQSKIPILEPEPTARTIIKAIASGKKLVTIPGYIYRVTRLGQALMSVNVFDWFAGRVLGIYTTMEHFVGRKNK